MRVPACLARRKGKKSKDFLHREGVNLPKCQ